MQKIEFIHAIDEIARRLKSQQIVELFKAGFAQPSNQYNYGLVRPLLFESKSQFDQIKLDENKWIFLERISGISIYDEKSLSDLSARLQTTTANAILTNNTVTQFYSFHNSLIDLQKISKELLSSELINNNYEDNIKLGIIIFQVQIETEGLETAKYIKILSALDDLVHAIEKIHKLEDSGSEIVLFDSGSNTNIGLESKVEVAKSIFQIFKEMWDFISSFQFYRAQQRNQALLESLTIRKELLKSVEDGILTENEAKEYLHIVKTRTDDLIGLKVLPRVLTTSDTKYDSNKILEEYRIKVLEEKNEK